MTLLPNEYEPTAEDRLWMLRAVEGEGAPERLVAQSLVNRFMFLRETRPGLYSTLASFVREYADPVDPKWATGGSKYEAKLKTLRVGTVERKNLVAAGQRRARHIALSEFGPRVIEAVERAFTRGPVDLPTPGTQHYFASHMKQDPDWAKRVTERATGKNVFFETKGVDWPGYYVREDRRMAVAGAAGLLVLVGYLAWGKV